MRIWTGTTLCWLVASGCAAEVGGSKDPGAAPMTPRTGGNDGHGFMPAPSTPPAGSAAAPAFACDPAAARVGDARIWRLTGLQYNNTIARLFGGPLEAVTAANEEVFRGGEDHGFLNGAFNLRVQEPQVGQLRTIARRTAEAVVNDPARLAGVFDANKTCPPGAANYTKTECVDAFLRNFGLRAFRRPLSNDELTAYKRLFDKARAHGATLGNGADTGHMGVRAVIEAMLQSPNFLYRTELPAGTGKAPLSSYELASALSYFLTDNMPDAELLAAAGKDELATPAQLEAQARRLLEGQGRPAVAELFRQWMNYEELKTREKDPARFPNWEELRAPMAEELRLFVENVVFDMKGKFADLFQTNATFVNPQLAPLYGEKVDTGWKKVATDPAQRAGLLTLSGLMAHTAVLDRTSPVNRGLLVQERIFCTHIADPPEGVDISVPALAPGLTRRQQLEMKTAAPLCSACHGILNGIGFGLESLDAIGRVRDKEENGLAIDPSGYIKGTRDSDGDFVGPRGLATAVARSDQARQCMTVQTFRYALGRGEQAGDNCSLAQAWEAFRASQFDLQTLLVGLVKTDAFRFRNVQP